MLVCSLENPSPEILRAFGRGAHEFFALPNAMLVACARDPLMNSIQRWKRGAADGIRVATHSGHRDLSVTRSIPIPQSPLSLRCGTTAGHSII
jgi:hypothetical protein